MNRTGTDLRERVQEELGRPDHDDMFDPDGDGSQYFRALTESLLRLRGKVAEFAPELLYEETTVAADDSAGSSYTLTDDWLGELELWTPPGVGRGLRILPGEPARYGEQRYWLEGRKAHMAIGRVYTPGIYVRWIPQTVADIDDSSADSGMPQYMDRWLIFDAAASLARRPGANLDYQAFDILRDEEWFGRRGDPSDVGILGHLTRLGYGQGRKHLGGGRYPWWAALQS